MEDIEATKYEHKCLIEDILIEFASIRSGRTSKGTPLSEHLQQEIIDFIKNWPESLGSRHQKENRSKHLNQQTKERK